MTRMIEDPQGVADSLLEKTPPRAPWIVLTSLWVSNGINVLFLLLDPRNPTFGPVTASLFLIGGLLYVVALILCHRDHAAGYVLAILLGVLASIVVVGDNIQLFDSRPDSVIAILNILFFLVQVPLVIFSSKHLLFRRGRRF